MDIINIFFCYWSDGDSIIYPGTICKKFVKSSFDSDQEVLIIILMYCCHQFSFGIERNFSDSRQGFFERVLVYQISDSCIYQCCLSRISYGYAVRTKDSIIGKYRHLQKFIDDRAVCCCIGKISCSIDVCHSHLVLSQCTCLVGADYSRASKCLYRRKIADNGILLRKSLDSKGKDNSRDSRKSLRNGSDSETDGSHEHFHQISAVAQTDYHNDDAYRQTDNCQCLSKFVEPYLHWCTHVGNRLDHRGDLSDFSLITDCCYHSLTVSVCHAAGTVSHIYTVSNRSIFRKNLFRILLHRH